MRQPRAKLSPLQSATPDHYATLGLDRNCTEAQIRAAYRLLAKQHHPDVNHTSPSAVAQTQALNAAYEVLRDPPRRGAYDRELATAKSPRPTTIARAQRLIAKTAHLRIEEFLRGTTLEIRVDDPGHPAGAETYELIVPPDTAPGTRFRLPRDGHCAGGFVVVRVLVRPDFRFKARGSDLRCDLRISCERARQGGTESVRGATGNLLRVSIPKQAARGEIIRLAGEGLPKARGGRGDLLVRILYRPEIQITRRTKS